MNKIPHNVLGSIREELWRRADELDWTRMPTPQKAMFYEQWQKDPQVGGILSNYAEVSNVRVYLKDTVMKPYARERTSALLPILQLLAITNAVPGAVDPFVKPHGQMLKDGKIICWGAAREWKSIILATSERAIRHEGTPYAAVLGNPGGRLTQPFERGLVQELAKKLGIQKIAWGSEVVDITTT